MSKEIAEETKQRKVDEINKETLEEKEKVSEESKDIKQDLEMNNEKNSIFKNKKAVNILMIGIIVLIIISAFVLFAVINAKSNKIMQGVYINNIDVSNLTLSEAKELLGNTINNVESQNIKLKYEDYELTIVPEQIEIKYDIDEALNKAYSIGRNDNIFLNNYNIIKSKLLKNYIEIQISFNEEKVNELINNIQASLPGAVEESSYSIEGEYLIITKGKRGIAVDSEELKHLIIEYEKKINKNENEEIQIPVTEKDPQEIDIEKIHNEIYTEAKDAYYNEEPFEIFPHVLGVDFSISIEEAKQILQQDAENYTIPLKITIPNVTTDKLGTKAFPDLLGKYTTTYASSSSNRKYNIARAASSINGKTLLPGEVFSYNKAIGNPSQANGYRLATGFANGKHVDSYGGGVCQVSSTLYNAVVYANLDIVSRANHSLPVGYVPVSRDATVYYGGVDFKFKNNRKYPIKVVATTSGSSITVEIFGRKENEDYEVVIESWVTSSIPYSVKYTDNPSLSQGTERVITKGSNGYRSVAYKILKRNGQEVSRTLLSSDTYSPENREIERGIGGYQAPAPVEETPAPIQAPDPTPQPSTTQETPSETEGEDDSGVSVTVE